MDPRQLVSELGRAEEQESGQEGLQVPVPVVLVLVLVRRCLLRHHPASCEIRTCGETPTIALLPAQQTLAWLFPAWLGEVEDVACFQARGGVRGLPLMDHHGVERIPPRHDK